MATSSAETPALPFLARRSSILISGGFFRESSRPSSPHGSLSPTSLEDRKTCCFLPNPYWMAPFLFLYSFNSIGAGPVVQGIAHELWADNAQIYFTFLAGFGGFIGIFAGPMVGILSDRWGRRPFLLWCALASFLPAFCLVVFDLTRDGTAFLVYFTMHVVANGLSPGLGLTHAYVSDTTSSKQRAVVMGRVMACGMGLSMITGPLVFASVGKTFGVKGFKYFFVSSSAVTPLVTLFIPESLANSRRSRRECVNPFQSIRLLTHSSRGVTFGGGKSTTTCLRFLFLMILAFYVAKMGILQAQGLFAQEVLGFSFTDVSVATTIYGIAQCAGQVAIILILRPLSKRAAAFVGVFCGVVAASLVAVPGMPGWILYVAQVPLALSYISFTIAVSMASQVVPKERVGEAVMAMNLAISFSNTLGPPLFGVCSKAFMGSSYPNGQFLVFACIMAIGLLLALCLPSDADLQADDWTMKHADQQGPDRPLGFSMQSASAVDDASLRAAPEAAGVAGGQAAAPPTDAVGS